MSGDPVPSSFDDDAEFFEEGRWQKLGRKLKEEPLIPLGCAATCYALYQATISMRKGDHDRVNRMFRARIYAQGFTILAVVAGGIYFADDRKRRKLFREKVDEKQAQDKKDAWIRELEAREKEEEEFAKKKKAYYAAMKEEAEKNRGSSAAKSMIEPSEDRSPIMEAVLSLIARRR